MAWRQWLKLYAGFTIFWTIFEWIFMFLPIVCLIDKVVLRSSPINGDDTAGAGGKWIRLKRLHADDRIFSPCTVGMIFSFLMFTSLQILQVGFFSFYGGKRTIYAFLFICKFFQILPNVFNCILLDNLPIVIAKRFKYQQPLVKTQAKRPVRQYINQLMVRAAAKSDADATRIVNMKGRYFPLDATLIGALDMADAKVNVGNLNDIASDVQTGKSPLT